MAAASLPAFDLDDDTIAGELPTGWGPPSAAVPALGPLPFLTRASVQRGAIGHAADWTDTSRARRRADPAATEEADEGDSQFQTVTNQSASTVVRFAHNKRWKQRSRHVRDSRNRQKDTRTANEVKGVRRFGENTRERRTKRNSRRPNFQRKKRWWTEPPKVRPDSIPPDESWESIKEIQFIDFGKLAPVDVAVQDLYACGNVYAYDRSMDGLTARNPRAMVEKKLDEVPLPSSTTSDDAKMREFIEQEAGTVFATDQLLSFLITAGRSEYSWDILITKRDNGALVLDRRPAARLDDLYVWEGSYNRPESDEPMSLMNPVILAQESTRVNYAFQMQAIPRGPGAKTHSLGNPPIAGQPDGVGYVYRKYTLPSGASIVVRGQIDAFEDRSSGKRLLKVCSVNEYQPSERFQGLYDWSTKLDGQKAAMWLTEVRNNAAKVGRWVCQALLANVDALKAGFVTRKDPKSRARHRILATQKVLRDKLPTTISFDFRAMFAVVEYFVRVLSDDRLAPGKYILIKDANRPLVKLSKVPSNAFKDEVYGTPLDYDVAIPMGELG